VAAGNKAVTLLDFAMGNVISKRSTRRTSLSDAVAFSPDGKPWRPAGRQNHRSVGTLLSGKMLITLSRHTEIVILLVFSPDGKTLASTLLRQDRNHFGMLPVEIYYLR